MILFCALIILRATQACTLHPGWAGSKGCMRVGLILPTLLWNQQQLQVLSPPEGIFTAVAAAGLYAVCGTTTAEYPGRTCTEYGDADYWAQAMGCPHSQVTSSSYISHFCKEFARCEGNHTCCQYNVGRYLHSPAAISDLFSSACHSHVEN